MLQMSLHYIEIVKEPPYILHTHPGLKKSANARILRIVHSSTQHLCKTYHCHGVSFKDTVKYMSSSVLEKCSICQVGRWEYPPLFAHALHRYVMMSSIILCIPQLIVNFSKVHRHFTCRVKCKQFVLHFPTFGENPPVPPNFRSCFKLRFQGFKFSMLYYFRLLSLLRLLLAQTLLCLS